MQSCLGSYQVSCSKRQCAWHVVCLKKHLPLLLCCCYAHNADLTSCWRALLTACAPQVIGPDQGDAYLKMKLKDQNKAMQILQESPSLQGLTQIQAPYVDLEVRGLPALQYFGNLVWQDAFKEQKGSILSHTQVNHKSRKVAERAERYRPVTPKYTIKAIP